MVTRTGRRLAAAGAAVSAMLLAPVLAGCELIAGISEIEDARRSCAAPDLAAGKAGCQEGFATCGGSGECAVDLRSDPENCGYCDHVCGGPCEDGVCTPVLVAQDPAPRGVAIRGGALFWASQGDQAGARPSIRQASIDTGAPGPERTLEAPPQWVAADGTHVYWTFRYTKCIGRSPLGGGPTELLGKCDGTYGGRLALDETHVFYVVRRETASQAGCTAEDGCCTTVDNTSCIQKLDKATGEVETLAVTSLDASAVAVDEAHVYWGEHLESPGTPADAVGAIKRCPKAGCPEGSGAETVATFAGKVEDIRIDAAGGFVYWMDSMGAGVLRAPLAGTGGVEPIIDTVPASTFYGGSLALDALFVYWTGDGHVYRASKKARQQRFDDLGGSAGAEMGGLAADCSGVYWSDWPEPQDTPGRVLRVAW